MTDAKLPAYFYNVPDTARSIFSTILGSKPKRKLQHPRPLPIIRSSMKGDIEPKALQLAKDFPEAVRNITIAPRRWEELYDYFDAVDLWVEGPSFLFYVIHKLAITNAAILTACTKEIEKFAVGWIASHEEMVARAYARGELDVLKLFDTFDRANLEEMLPAEIGQLRDALDFHRGVLFARFDAEARFQASHGPQHAAYFRYMQSQTQQAQQSMVPFGSRAIPPLQHQGYENSKEGQRNPPPTPSTGGMMPTGPRSEYCPVRIDSCRYGPGHTETRPRGWSNDTAQYGRSRANSRISNPNTGRRWGPNTNLSRSSPPLIPSPVEPIYVLNNHRNVSDPGKEQNLMSQLYRRNTQSAGYRPHPYRSESSSNLATLTKDSSHHSSIEQINESATCLRGAESLSPAEPSNGIRAISQEAAPLTAIVDSPNTRATLPNDAKLLTKDNTPAYHRKVVAPNGAITYLYKENVERPIKNEVNTRTLHISGITRWCFEHHIIMGLLSQCGEVESITYLESRRQDEYQSSMSQYMQLFVTFTDHTVLPSVITRFNGFQMPSGLRLKISYRARQGSDGYRPFGHHQPSHSMVNHPPRDGDSRPPTTRRNSIRSNYSNSYYNAPGHSRTSSSTHDSVRVDTRVFQVIPVEQLRSTISEVVQHESALNMLGNKSQTLLDTMENRACFDRNTRNGPLPQASMVNQKENSPFVALGKNSNGKFEGGKDNNTRNAGKKNKRKGSKQNTSTRPTPTTTPIKSRSELNLANTLTTSIRGGTTKCSVSKSYEKEDLGGKNATLSESKPGGAAPARLTPQQVDPREDKGWTSEIQAIPVLAENQARLEIRTSSDSKSVAGPVLSDHDVPAEKLDFPRIKPVDIFNQKKNFRPENADMLDTKSKKVKGHNKRKPTSSFQGQVDKSNNALDTVNTISPFSMDYNEGIPSKSTNTSISTVSSRKQSVASGLDENISQRAEMQSSIANQTLTSTVRKTPPHFTEQPMGVDAKPNPREGPQTTWNSTSRKSKTRSHDHGQHSKTSSVTSTGSHVSLRIADSKSESEFSNGKSSNSEIMKLDVTHPAPKIVSDNLGEWPSLGPANAPASNIADGKRPPPPRSFPIMGSLNASTGKGTSKMSKPVVAGTPAVLNLPRHQPQSTMEALVNEGDIGSESWPYVKAVKGK